MIYIGAALAAYSNGRILLVRESRGAKSGQWNLPSGRPEQFESLSACAEREFHEETGLIGVSGGLMALFETLVGPEDRVLYYVFCCREWQTGALLDGAEWMTLPDAERLFAAGLVRSEAVIEVCRRLAEGSPETVPVRSDTAAAAPAITMLAA